MALEPQVFDLLAFLIRNRDRVITQDDLLAGVWKGRIVSESTLRSRINAARAAIGDNGEEQRLIRPLPRRGFRFVGSVHEHSDEVIAAGVEPSATVPVRTAWPAAAFAACAEMPLDRSRRPSRLSAMSTPRRSARFGRGCGVRDDMTRHPPD